MHRVSLAKIFLIIAIGAFVISTIEAAPERIHSKRAGNHEPLCPCPRMYWPVCGSDQITYANKCLLDCAAKTRSVKLMKNVGCDQEEDPFDAEPFLP